MIDRTELVDTLPRLRRYARLLTGDRFRADDLVQDALERAIERESSFRSGENLRAWLFAIMHNLFIDGVRGKEAIDWAVDPGNIPEMAAPKQSDPVEVRDLLKAMAQLQPDQRAVLLLIGVEGLRYREAADILNLPVGTIMSRLARAREKMQELLGETAAAPSLGGAL